MNHLDDPHAWWRFWQAINNGAPSARCPGMLLRNGWIISVQAGDHYASHSTHTGWISFELGYPSWPDLRLLEYAERPEDPCDTIYRHVPYDVLKGIMDSFGGAVGYTDWADEPYGGLIAYCLVEGLTDDP